MVENRPGASQAIALEAAARSAPDGHTLIVGTQSGFVLLTVARKTLPYDPLKDFASVGLMFSTPFYLVVHPSVPARSVQELIEQSGRDDRAHPLGASRVDQSDALGGYGARIAIWRRDSGLDQLTDA